MSGRARRATRPTACLFGALGRRRLRPPRTLTRSRRSCPADFAGANPGESPAVGRVYRQGSDRQQRRYNDPNRMQRRRARPSGEPTTAFGLPLDFAKANALARRDGAKRIFSQIEFLTFCKFVFWRKRFSEKSIFAIDRRLARDGKRPDGSVEPKRRGRQFMALLSHIFGFAQYSFSETFSGGCQSAVAFSGVLY